MISLLTASLGWTYKPLLMQALSDSIAAATWVVVIVAGYLILEAVNRNDDDPDGYA